MLRPPKPHWGFALTPLLTAGRWRNQGVGCGISTLLPGCPQGWSHREEGHQRDTGGSGAILPLQLTPETITKPSRASVVMAEHPKSDLPGEHQPCSPATPGHGEG